MFFLLLVRILNFLKMMFTPPTLALRGSVNVQFGIKTCFSRVYTDFSMSHKFKIYSLLFIDPS